MSISPKTSVELNCKSKHLERIKREEDEEQWISGEELYTEGSSDEDEKGKSREGSGRRMKREHRGARPKVQRRIMKADTSPSPIPKPPGIEIPTADRDSDSADEPPPADISWKPKRGSIRLPNLTCDSHDSLQRHNQIMTSTTEALKE